MLVSQLLLSNLYKAGMLEIFESFIEELFAVDLCSHGSKSQDRTRAVEYIAILMHHVQL